MPLITPEVVLELQEIVQLHHEVVLEAFNGVQALPESIATRIAELDLPRWPSEPIVNQAVALGQMMAATADPGEPAATITPEIFRERLRIRRDPLSRGEMAAISYAQERAGVYCRGLGNTVAKGIDKIILEASPEYREMFEEAIQTETAEAIRWRETRDRLRTRLGRATGDWSRDLARIATTELHNAKEEGHATEIEAEAGKDAWVAKRPNPDACDACKAFYLDENDNPKLFRLSDLRGKTNAIDPEHPHRHRKRANWVATLESLHPFCACQTVYVPTGLGYSESGQLLPLSMLSGSYLEIAQDR